MKERRKNTTTQAERNSDSNLAPATASRSGTGLRKNLQSTTAMSSSSSRVKEAHPSPPPRLQEQTPKAARPKLWRRNFSPLGRRKEDLFPDRGSSRTAAGALLFIRRRGVEIAAPIRGSHVVRQWWEGADASSSRFPIPDSRFPIPVSPLKLPFRNPRFPR